MCPVRNATHVPACTDLCERQRPSAQVHVAVAVNVHVHVADHVDVNDGDEMG
jgi:hypothetical protein